MIPILPPPNLNTPVLAFFVDRGHLGKKLKESNRRIPTELPVKDLIFSSSKFLPWTKKTKRTFTNSPIAHWVNNKPCPANPTRKTSLRPVCPLWSHPKCHQNGAKRHWIQQWSVRAVFSWHCCAEFFRLTLFFRLVYRILISLIFENEMG